MQRGRWGGVVGGGGPVNISPELKRGRYQNTPFPALDLKTNRKECPKQNPFFFSLEDL